MVLVDAAIAWRDKKFTERVRKAADRARAGSATDPVAMAMAEALAEARAKGRAAAHAKARADQQSFAKAYGMGLEQGREEAHRTWRDWYARFADAKARGVPFDEAPPAP